MPSEPSAPQCDHNRRTAREFSATPMLVEQLLVLFCQTAALRAFLLQKALSQTNQVFCSLTPGWAVSALAESLSGSAHPRVFKNGWTLSQPSSFRIHGLKVHLQTDLSKSGQPCWLTNTLSLLIKTKLQITTVTKNSYPLLTFAQRPKQNRINPKYRWTYVQLSHGSLISPICLRKHCTSSLTIVFSQKLLPFRSPKCSWAVYISLCSYI